MVVINSKTGAVHRNDEYYAFAHFSRFVLPGAVRVWSTDTGPDIHNVAFRNADDGSIVLVVANGRRQASRLVIAQDKLSFDYTMPPESVATFVWSMSAPSLEQRTRQLFDKVLRAMAPNAAGTH